MKQLELDFNYRLRYYHMPRRIDRTPALVEICAEQPKNTSTIEVVFLESYDTCRRKGEQWGADPKFLTLIK